MVNRVMIIVLERVSLPHKLPPRFYRNARLATKATSSSWCVDRYRYRCCTCSRMSPPKPRSYRRLHGRASDWFVWWLLCKCRPQATSQLSESVITLKGSTELVTEFFAYSINRCAISAHRRVL